jgi:hypothetical protein
MRRVAATLMVAATLLAGGCSAGSGAPTRNLEQGVTELSQIKVPATWSSTIQSSGVDGGRPVWDWSYSAPEATTVATTDYTKAITDAGWTARTGGTFVKDTFVLTPSATAAACRDGKDSCSSVAFHLTTK